MQCGNELEENDVFCPYCGKKVTSLSQEETHAEQNQDEFPQVLEETGTSREKEAETPILSQEDLQKVKTAVTDAAGKAVVGAQKIASTIGQKVEEQKAAIQQSVQREIQKANPVQENRVNAGSRVEYKSNYGRPWELWTWLKKDAKKQQFYSSTESDMTIDDYMSRVQEKINDNRVPAKIEQRKVYWDRSNVEQEVFMIRPETKAANPLSCLLQFNHVGNFTFVEEKTFITPPSLPKYPDSPIALDPNLAARAAWLMKGLLVVLAGALCIFLGIRQIALILIIAGAVLAALGYFASIQVDAIREHNKDCEEQRIAWNKAWAEWKQNMFLHSFQEDTNGHLSRIFDSVFSCIKQVNSELFEGKAVTEEDESADMNELEQLIARRQEEYR